MEVRRIWRFGRVVMCAEEKGDVVEAGKGRRIE
jgi:hypothetical protein